MFINSYGKFPPAIRLAFNGVVQMKKIDFTGLILIALLVALPGAVSAAPSDTVIVSGSIGGSIDVTAGSDIDFSSMAVGTETGSVSTSVTTTYTTWYLRASDASATNKGYMVRAGPVALQNPIRIGTETNPTAVLTTNPYVVRTGTAAGTFTDTVNVAQQIVGTDAAGSYSITITLTGSTT